MVRAGRRDGFTLLELLIVIVLIAALGGLLLPSPGGLLGLRIRNASRIVAADLEYTAQRAIATGLVHRWVVAPVPISALDLRQGSLRDTGRDLDLALNGPGFFVVDTPGGERLTRGGGFKLDPAGQLVDRHDNPVLGVDGPLFISGTSVEVQHDGIVLVDGAKVGQLRIETVNDPAALQKEEGGVFLASAALQLVDPTETRVRQGAIEESNFDPILGTIDLITVAREFHANMTALQAMDEVLGRVANDIGRPMP